LVTVNWRVSPGTPEVGAMATCTPSSTTERLPAAVAVTDPMVVEAAITSKA
jgi:hypothetical protein